MIKTVEMFSVECDNCKKVYIDENRTGFCAWSDSGLAQESADDDGWHCDGDGKHYCPKCFTIDDNDNLILKQLKEMK